MVTLQLVREENAIVEFQKNYFIKLVIFFIFITVQQFLRNIHYLTTIKQLLCKDHCITTNRNHPFKFLFGNASDRNHRVEFFLNNSNYRNNHFTYVFCNNHCDNNNNKNNNNNNYYYNYN